MEMRLRGGDALEPCSCPELIYYSVESHNVDRSQSPFAIGSPSHSMESNVSPPVLWIKDRQKSMAPLKSDPHGCRNESYHDFRQDGLRQREQSALGKDHFDMTSLYGFWSHFLVGHFNPRMYEEFHRLALEDGESSTGMRNLLQYYDESILSQRNVLDDNVARDVVDLVNAESSKSERPILTKLRAVWRNGAFNLRNRSKLAKFVGPDLKADLER